MIENVVKIAKTMKRPIVYITPTYMLGTDDEFCTLSKINIESDIIRPMAFRISDCLLGTTKDKYAQAHPEIFFSEYTHIQDDMYINTWQEPVLMNTLIGMYMRVSRALDGLVPIYSSVGFEKDDNFMQTVAKLKVSSGLQSYVLEGAYIQTSFNKVHAINANDKVSLNIYDIDYESYMYEFIIDKKKYQVVEYIRYRKMI